MRSEAKVCEPKYPARVWLRMTEECVAVRSKPCTMACSTVAVKVEQESKLARAADDECDFTGAGRSFG